MLGKRRIVDVRIQWACILLVICVSLACGKKTEQSQAKQTPPMTQQDQTLANLGLNPARGFEPGGVQIQYQAAANLNFYDSKPHTLTLVIYQMEGNNKFNELVKGEDGLIQLLQAERFDPAVVAVDQLFIEPGDQKTVILDRAEKAKWVGVVAGYYNLAAGQVSRSYEIPVSVEKKGIYGFRTTEAKVEKLVVQFFMGPNSIQEVKPK